MSKKRLKTKLYRAACAALKALDADLTVHERSNLAYAALSALIAYSNAVGAVTFIPTSEIP